MLSTTASLKQPSLRDQALRVIREGMVSGELAPGEIYSATALANQLGVSASPVREAMLTLVNQGLMEAVRNRGFRVLPLDDDDRREIYEMRTLLEIPATAALAGRQEIADDYETYRGIAEEIVAAARRGDLIDYLDADRRFHLGLLAFGNNHRLVHAIDGLRDNTRLYGLKNLSDNGTLVASAEEHLPILDAIVADRPDEVRDLMQHHLRHIRGDWADPGFVAPR
ncbi:GntR family transcriptional regulator [Mycobacterium yunnanensis]|uniref:GntR family transcriptional regulator n=1 Tax=Mycobacterium yunnanensis TaxID=368477 RepID=A0A9X2Z0I9_9MYCO|nr:GntR family transcriptional regulator [Mycobacterium yunnanensis]MCV7420731.1 GntR family transcriptional regulator [Mycobacterium yunnanensis]